MSLLLLLFSAYAAAVIPAPPQLATRAHILLDAYSGQVVVEHNADERLGPASITKIMTSYVVYHELAKNTFALDTLVPVSKKACR